MDEKVLPRASRRFNAVGFTLISVRIWQWSSSFFVFGSFNLLYGHVQKNRLGENSRMKAVEILGLVSLIYATIVICGVHICKTLGLRSWIIFAMSSLAGDLTSIGFCIAQIAILSFSGLPTDCHGLTRDNYNDNDLVRQPADGYSTIRFGSWTTAMTGELDRWCTLPRTVYGLSVIAIYSHILSLLLSVLYLQQLKREALDGEKLGLYQASSPRPRPRYIGEHISSHTDALSILDLEIGSRPPSRTPSPGQGSTRSTRSLSTNSRTESWSGITLDSGGSNSSNSSDTDSVRSGGSLPPAPLPGSSEAPPRRWSTSTSSSFNANAFLVTDGFSHPEQAVGETPPAYESRPGSLYNETMKYPAGLGIPGTPKP